MSKVTCSPVLAALTGLSLPDPVNPLCAKSDPKAEKRTRYVRTCLALFTTD